MDFLKLFRKVNQQKKKSRKTCFCLLGSLTFNNFSVIKELPRKATKTQVRQVSVRLISRSQGKRVLSQLRQCLCLHVKVERKYDWWILICYNEIVVGCCVPPPIVLLPSASLIKFLHLSWMCVGPISRLIRFQVCTSQAIAFLCIIYEISYYSYVWTVLYKHLV